MSGGANRVEAISEQLLSMEVMLKSSLASMPDVGNAVHSELADHLGMISSLQASVSAGIAISPASLQLAINRVQQETLQLALKKSDQQTIAAVLAEQMLQAEEARLSREASDFRIYENEASSRIQSLAEASGINISTYEQNRSDILASREAAQASGDIVEAYKQDALLAANNRHGMTLVDAPEEEQERARKEEEAAKERYLRQVEIMAMREAQRMGLSGEQATEYVVSQREEAELQFDEEINALGVEGQQHSAQQQPLVQVMEIRNEQREYYQSVTTQAEPIGTGDTNKAINLETELRDQTDILAMLNMQEADIHTSKVPSASITGERRFDPEIVR